MIFMPQGVLDSNFAQAQQNTQQMLSDMGRLPSADVTSSSNDSTMSYWEGLMASQGKLAAEAQLFNSQEAEKQRKWQEYMSNTSYQRAVKDLQAAGLNPILAYQQGGATTPTGGSASVNVPAGDTLTDFLNSFSYLISSVGDIAKLLSGFDFSTDTKSSYWKGTSSGQVFNGKSTSSAKPGKVLYFK